MKKTEGGIIVKVEGVFVCGSVDELLEKLFTYNINYFELTMKETLRKHTIEVDRDIRYDIPVRFIVDGKTLGIKGFLSFLLRKEDKINFPVEIKEIKTLENKNELIPTAISFLLQYQYIYLHLFDKPLLIEKSDKDKDILDCISRYEVYISFNNIFELEDKLKSIIENFKTIA